MRPNRQKVALAFLGSVVLHGAALVLFALIVAWRPADKTVPPPDEEPIKMEVAEEPTPEPLADPEADATPTPTPKVIRVVDSGDAAEATPPPDTATYSDRDTVASNTSLAEGEQAVPTQSGRRLASFMFDPAPPPAETPPAATPPPVTAPTLPQPDRAARTPAPAATPVPTAAPDEFAEIMATPKPPEDPFDPSFRSTSPPAPQPAVRPAARRTPAPVVSSAEQGNVVNRGAGGVNTVATPISRYTSSARDSIKFIWKQMLDASNNAPLAGTVVVHLIISRDGQVLGPRVISNSSNALLATITLQAVAQTRLPPMPPEATAELAGKLLPVDITFDYLPGQ